jgi:hypothetical protein
MSYFDDREYDGDSEYDGQSVYDDQSDNDDQNDCNDPSEYDHLGDLQRQAEQRERCPYRICQDCHHEHECIRVCNVYTISASSRHELTESMNIVRQGHLDLGKPYGQR